MSGTEERSILEMSDEEIANLDPSTFNQGAGEATEQDPVNADPEPITDETPADEAGEGSGEGSQGQSADPDDTEPVTEDSTTGNADESSEDVTDAQAKGNKESTPKQKPVQSSRRPCRRIRRWI